MQSYHIKSKLNAMILLHKKVVWQRTRDLAVILPQFWAAIWCMPGTYIRACCLPCLLNVDPRTVYLYWLVVLYSFVSTPAT